MKATVKKYTDRDRYDNDGSPDSSTMVGSVKEGLDMCRKEIARIRDTQEFIGFRITTLKDVTVHKLPSY